MTVEPTPTPAPEKTPAEKLDNILNALIVAEEALAKISNKLRIAKRAVSKLIKEQSK